MMGLVETEAFVLRTYKLAEADKVVLCLTREAGLVRGVARGARRLKSRYGASLEPFTHVALVYYEREGRELVSVRQAEIVRSYFARFAREAETLGALEYLSELVVEFAPPHEPNERLFRMVKACVEALAEEPRRLPLVLRYFELWTLRLAGFLPDLAKCSACHRRLRREGEAVFLGQEGALRCGACAGGLGVEVSREAHGQMRAMQSAGPREWAEGAGREAGPGVREELAQLLRRYLARALERAPRGQPGLV